MATSIQITGLDAAIAKLEGVEERLRDLTPAMTVVAQDLKTLIDTSFATSMTPDGFRWAPLADATVRRRRNGSSMPLIDTGVLRNSITTRAGTHSATFGTSVPYAGFHQFGAPEASIRARPFFPVVADSGGFAFMAGGPAGAELDRIRNLLISYVTTGQIT